jgi:hypothetical protein
VSPAVTTKLVAHTSAWPQRPGVTATSTRTRTADAAQTVAVSRQVERTPSTTSRTLSPMIPVTGTGHGPAVLWAVSSPSAARPARCAIDDARGNSGARPMLTESTADTSIDRGTGTS